MRERSLGRMALTAISFLLLLCFHAINAECVSEYYADDVDKERASQIPFYFTALEIRSAFDCAQFCAQRKFCRSAVYNSFGRSCGISYSQQVNCINSTSRYLDDFHAKGHLVLLACFKDCHEYRYRARTPQIITSDSQGILKKKVQLITGEPHDGFDTAPDPPSQTLKSALQIFNQQHDLPSLPVSIPVKGKVCFTTTSESYLLGADFQKIYPATINECRCLCAATWKNESSMHKCLSLHYSVDAKSCYLNKGTHLGKYDLIHDKSMTYQQITCDVQVMLAVAGKVCQAATQENLAALFNSTWATTTTVQPINSKKQQRKVARGSEEIQTIKPITTTTIASTTPSTTTQSTTTLTRTLPTTTTAKAIESTIASTTASTTLSTTTLTTPETSTTVKPADVDNDLLEKREEPKLGSQVGCFEVIPGHLMLSSAGGLEQGISLEECMCICANSKTSGKYIFECVSATYYENEKDCVLNIEDRTTRKEAFQVSENVTYLGLTCSRGEALAQHTKADQKAGCFPIVSSTTTSTTATTTFPSQKDKCFEELPAHVLEGTALAVEASVSPLQCKCYCANADKRYGENCQSAQYYFESKTCLINKQNRFSNPEDFNAITGGQIQSYLEYKCAAKEQIKQKYLAEDCREILPSSDLASDPESSTENDLKKTGTTKKTPTTVAKDEGDEEDEEEATTSKPKPKNKKRKEKKVKRKAHDDHEVKTTKKDIKTTGKTTLKPKRTTISQKTTSSTPTPTPTTTTAKKLRRKAINFNIPEAEGLDPKDFENDLLDSEDEEKLLKKLARKEIEEEEEKNKKKKDKEVEKVKKEVAGEDVTVKNGEEKVKLQKPTTKSKSDSTTVKPTSFGTKESKTTKAIKQKEDQHKKHDKKSELTKPTKSTTTTTTAEPTTPFNGRCTYSAMYSTAFHGIKLIKEISVRSPAECFAECFRTRCRSANLINGEDTKSCELFRDSLIDYRRPDVLAYDTSAVYFDGIQCSEN
ncbi:unnamed protein product, partial [Mesorhabditis belari]|uniref:Apple domain-containing protein n=1 Tax=Mesorhabditis belari TaxID=2138241 RepID=A0AAF3EH65_9BILA